jgi:hypothetical protein
MNLSSLIFMIAMAAMVSVACASHSLYYIERGETDTLIPSGVETGVGDLDVFNNGLYDARNEVKIGQHDGLCARIPDVTRWFCSWNVLMPDEDNKIFLQGTIFNDNDKVAVIGIVGGSGDFFGAQGSATIVSRNGDFFGNTATWEFNLTYDLPSDSGAASLLAAPLLVIAALCAFLF